MSGRNRSGKRPKKHRTSLSAPKLPPTPPPEAILVCEEDGWDPIDDAACVLGWDDEYAGSMTTPPGGPMREAVVVAAAALVLIAVVVTGIAMFGGAF